MKRSSAEKSFHDFVHLRDQANLIAQSDGPLSLWIACTDHAMAPVLERIARRGSTVFLRQSRFEVPTSKADLLSELSAINFAVERLQVSDIVVCGHSFCSSFSGSRREVNCTSASDGIEMLRQGVIHRQALNDQLRKHLVRQLQILETYASVQRASRSGTLRTHGLFYLAESESFSCYDRRTHRFAHCDEKGSGLLNWP